MYIVTVIPIHNIPGKDFLSYFSSKSIPIGYIVVIPVRSKKIHAIVVEIREAKDLKASLKNADYELKKITEIKGPSPFPDLFFLACQKSKDYFITNTGPIIQTLLPKLLIENIDKINSITKEESLIPIEGPNEIINKDLSKNDKLIFQAVAEDRLAFYRTLIREAFAKKESIFICVPTKFEINKFKNELSRGIEQYVFVFHGDMPKKEIIKSYNDCLIEKHPILIIGTGTFLSLYRKDLQTLILENESSSAYKRIKRPFVDLRTFAELIASTYKIKLIIGDTILRPETLYRHDNNELGEISSPLFRLPQVEYKKIIDMKKEENDKGLKTFNLLSRESIQTIKQSISLGQSIFLFSVRKGLAPITICQDCSSPLLCEECKIPMVLYGSRQLMSTKTTQPRIFMCNKCGNKIKTEIRCQNCNSWNLIPLGIGTDRIYEEIKKIFPMSKVIQIDKDTMTDKEASQAIDYFQKKPGCILLGTEMAFYYLNNKVDHSIIVSLDGLLSIPNFNINQKIIHIIEKMQSLTSKSFIIQTRLPDNQLLKLILNGNILPLFREELNERKNYGYPPFKRLIKITFSGTKEETEKARNTIDRLLGNYDPQIFSAYVGKNKGQYITNTVIKVNPELWPIPINEINYEDNHLFQILKTLPPNFSINVDPEDLL